MVGHFCSTIHFSAVSGNWWNQPSVGMVVWAWMQSCTRWSMYCSIQALSWNRRCFFEIEAFLQLLPNSTIISEYHATATEIMIFQETVWTEPSQLHVRASCVPEIKNLWFNTGIFTISTLGQPYQLALTIEQWIAEQKQSVSLYQTPLVCLEHASRKGIMQHCICTEEGWHNIRAIFTLIAYFTFLYKSNLSELLYYINPN